MVVAIEVVAMVVITFVKQEVVIIVGVCTVLRCIKFVP